MLVLFLYSHHAEFTPATRSLYWLVHLTTETRSCSSFDVTLNVSSSETPTPTIQSKAATYQALSILFPWGYFFLYSKYLKILSVHFLSITSSTRRQAPWEQGCCLSCSLLGPQCLDKWLAQGTHAMWGLCSATLFVRRPSLNYKFPEEGSMSIKFTSVCLVSSILLGTELILNKYSLNE